jgi:hypothetical protein
MEMRGKCGYRRDPSLSKWTAKVSGPCVICVCQCVVVFSHFHWKIFLLPQFYLTSWSFEDKKRNTLTYSLYRWTWRFWMAYISHGHRHLRSLSIIIIIKIIIVLVIVNYILYLILIASLFYLLSMLRSNQTTQLRGSLKCQPTSQNQVLSPRKSIFW